MAHHPFKWPPEPKPDPNAIVIRCTVIEGPKPEPTTIRVQHIEPPKEEPRVVHYRVVERPTPEPQRVKVRYAEPSPPKRDSTPMTFRFTPIAKDLLHRVAGRQGISMTAVLELAIREQAQRLGIESD